MRRLGAVVLAVQLAAPLDDRRAHLPGPVGEHHHVGADLGGRIDRVLAGSHGIDAPVEGVFRTRPDLDARLLVVFAVALDETGLERVDDHRRGLVEATARFIHAEAEGGELAPGQPSAHAEPELALAQHVEDGGVLGHPQRVVPGQDDGRRAEAHAGTYGGEVRHQVQVVGHEGVVVEMVLGRPQHVEPGVGGEPCQPDLLVPHLVVRAVVPAVAGEHHHHADVHARILLIRVFLT